MRVWFTLGLLVAMALSGCTSDEDPQSNDVVLEDIDEAALEGLVFEHLNGTSVEDEFTFAFFADIEDVNATWSVTSVLVASGEADGNETSEDEAEASGNETAGNETEDSGNETADSGNETEDASVMVAEGMGLPANFTTMFDAPGAYELSLDVRAEGFAPASAVLKVLVEAAEGAAEGAEADVPRGPQEAIQITGTITGAAGETESNMETFELVSIPSKMTLTFTQGATAADMDYYVSAPDGTQAGSAASFEALGGGPGASEAPIEITGPALEQLGEWTIEVVGYAAVEGAYTIDITFA